jgi:hypothetical protein
MCPPEPGRWLADFFASRDGVQVNFRDDDEGCGHMTFCRGQHALPETSIITALLGGRSQDREPADRASSTSALSPQYQAKVV